MLFVHWASGFCESSLRQGKDKQRVEQPKIHGPAAESPVPPERYRAEREGGEKNKKEEEGLMDICGKRK